MCFGGSPAADPRVHVCVVNGQYGVLLSLDVAGDQCHADNPSYGEGLLCPDQSGAPHSSSYQPGQDDPVGCQTLHRHCPLQVIAHSKH